MEAYKFSDIALRIVEKAESKHKANLPNIYWRMSDADLAREIRLNYTNHEYLIELWAEEDRRASLK